MVKWNITQIKKLWLLASVVAKKNSWGFNMFKEISSLSFKYMKVALTGSHFRNWCWSYNYWDFSKRKARVLTAGLTETVAAVSFLILLQILTRLVPVTKSFLFSFFSGCRQMTDFFFKTRKSTSPSIPALASAPTPQSCPVSQGKALVMGHGQMIIVSVQITWSMRSIVSHWIISVLTGGQSIPSSHFTISTLDGIRQKWFLRKSGTTFCASTGWNWDLPHGYCCIVVNVRGTAYWPCHPNFRSPSLKSNFPVFEWRSDSQRSEKSLFVFEYLTFWRKILLLGS